MTPRTWLQKAITAATPALKRELHRQLTDRADTFLRTGAAPVDPVAAALETIDRSLQRRAETPPERRGLGWREAADLALDYRLQLMAERERGFRIVDRRTASR